MHGMSNPVSRALGLMAVFAVAAHAQAAASKECPIDENNPPSLAKASFMVKRAQGSQDARYVAQQLAPAVKALTENAGAMANQPGRNLVLGRALVLWSMQPNVTMLWRPMTFKIGRRLVWVDSSGKAVTQPITWRGPNGTLTRLPTSI